MTAQTARDIFTCPKDQATLIYEHPYIAEQWHTTEVWSQYYCRTCGSRVLYEGDDGDYLKAMEAKR